MSQNNTDFSNDMSGVELLDDYLTPMQENINTSNSGVQRPSYAKKGTVWLDTSSTPAVYKMFDGEKDVIIGKVDDTFQPATPLTTAGDILIQGTDGNLNKLAAGTAGTILTSNGTGELPSYQVNPIGILTYSASYTYKKNDIVVSTSEDDETALYKSLVDSNKGNALTDDTKWEKLLLGGGGGDNIGDIKYTARTDVPNGGAWCDGAEYTKAMFPDIYQMLVDGKIQSTTYTNFASSVSTNGSCGFFAIDTGTKKFKVPLLKDVYIKVGQAPSMFGAESLPNIKHSVQLNSNNAGGPYIAPKGEGAFFVDNSVQQGAINSTNNGNTGILGFDASRSSAVYQDGAKVNPDHVVYRAYVVLYASAAGASEAQAQEFMTALGGKANVGLDNISAAGKNVIAGLGMPSDKYIDLDLQFTNVGGGYTAESDPAPANGYYVFVRRQLEASHLLRLDNINTNISSSMFNPSSSQTLAIYVPAKKQEIAKFTYNGNGDNMITRFVYAEGSKE